MSGRLTRQTFENPTAEDLRNALAGLRALSLVQISAHPLEDGRSSDELYQCFGNKWLAILLGKSASPVILLDEPGLPEQYLGSVLKTGVSVVARRGVFCTEYYVPGNPNAIRNSMRIPLNGIRPPINAKGNLDVKINPLWWWESPRRLEILPWIERAVLDRFGDHIDFMIQAQTEKAVLAMWPYLERCVADVERLFGDRTKASDVCSRIFREYGIELLAVETFAEDSYPSRENFRSFWQIPPASSEEIREAYEATMASVAKISNSRITRQRKF